MSFNLIINLGGEQWQMNQLEIRKSKEEKNKVKILNLTSEDLLKEPSQSEIKLFKKIDSSTRIYIVDHGSPNSPSITHGHYSEVADYLAKRINKKNLESSKNKLKIGLLSCNAAVGDEKSFAGLFHRYLGQQKKIDADVLARNQVVIVNANTMTRGVKTMPLLNYAIKKGLYDLGLKSIFESGDVREGHQIPGTKVKFIWDKKGNELMLDAYIDHFAKMNENLAKDIYKSLKDSNDTILIDKIKPLISNLIILSKESEKITLKKIDSITRILTELNDIISISTIKDKTTIQEQIKRAIEFKDRSINSSSLIPVNLNFNINQPSDTKNPNSYIKTKLYKPISLQLNKLPKSEEKENLKKFTLPFMEFLGFITNERIKHEKSIAREEAIFAFIRSALITTNSIKLSKEEKYLEIQLLKAQIEKLIKDEVVISHAIKGALEGLGESMNYGGLTTVKSLLPLVSGRSQEEKTNADQLFVHIENFTSCLIEFIDKTNYKGFDSHPPANEFIEEAKKITNLVSIPINKALSNTDKLLVDAKLSTDINIKLRDKIKTQIKNNHDLIKQIETRLEKMLFSIENSPDERLKEIYNENCISILINELDDLSASTALLELGLVA